MKRFWAILVAAMLIVSTLPVLASAEGDTADKPTISVAIMDRGTVPADKGDYENNWATQWIQENAPVNVNFVAVPRWDTYTTYNLWLASGTSADIIMEFQPEYVQEWSGEGMLTELAALIDENAPTYRANTPAEVQVWGQYNGGEYAMVNARAESGVVNHMVYIRKDWLDALGLEMPQSMDELMEVIRAFTEDDPDGNGEDDTWGWSLALQGQSIIQNMMGVHGSNWTLQDGEFISDYCSEAMLQAFKYIEQIYDNGWCDKEYLSDTNGTNAYSQFSTGKLGIIACGAGYLSSTIWETLMANDPDAVVAPMPSPTEYGYYQERECSLLNCIPSTCADPAAAVSYMEWMYTEGWQKVMYGDEGVDFEYRGDVIYRLGDDDDYAEKFNYTQEYGILSPYKVTIDMFRETYEAYDDSNILKQAYLIQADAMDETKDIPFHRETPTADLGLSVYNELMPDMNTLAAEYFAKAVNEADYTSEQAQQQIIDEFDGMGYQEVKTAFNEEAKNQGLLG